jgi:mono/diheme cytochrome c family protein
MSLCRLLTASAIVAVSSVAAFDGSSMKTVLPAADVPKLIEAEAKIISSTLAAGIGEKKMGTKVKVSALMVAQYAQNGMVAEPGKAAQYAGLRDRAVQLSKAAETGNADEAKALAKTLTLTGGPATKPDALDVAKLMDLDELMQQFKPERGGGKELEKKLQFLAKRRAALTPAEVADAASVGLQSAVIGQLAERYAPDADLGSKKKADWVKWSQDMAALSLDVAKVASAAKPDEKAVKAALKKLDDNCAKCHSVFKDG